MFAVLTPLDYAILAFFAAAWLACGIYFSARQRDTGEFLFAGRSLTWRPLSMSLMATLVAGPVFFLLPAAGYEQGLKTWVIPAAFWIVLPLVVYVIIPLYRGLGVGSIYEYLELRFDGRVRMGAGLAFAVWRVAILGAVALLPCRAALIAAGWEAAHSWWLIGLVGITATLGTLLGGQRGLVWITAAAGLAMTLAVVMTVAAVWLELDGGPARVVEIAEGLGRTQVEDAEFHWSDTWTPEAALPHWCLAILALLVADQATAQRFLVARSIHDARNAYFAAALGLTLLVPGLLYAGVCLLAFYHDHPGELRPEWVVNLDGQTRQPMRGADGRLLLDPNNPAHEISPLTLERLIAERRILKPNSKEPFTSADELLDSDTNRVLVEKLAMRRPPRDAWPERFGGEVIVSREAPLEMLPQFVATRLPMGTRGLIVVASLAAAIVALMTLIHGLTTYAVVDLHRRYGWMRGWLARKTTKTPDELTGADELRLARPLSIVIGIAATLLAVVQSQFGLPWTLETMTATIGGPLLAVFLLGMLTRRATAAAVILAFVLGIAFAVGLMTLRPAALAETWHLASSFGVTAVAGYLLSFVVGRGKQKSDLRGLVVGSGVGQVSNLPYASHAVEHSVSNR